MLVSYIYRLGKRLMITPQKIKLFANYHVIHLVKHILEKYGDFGSAKWLYKSVRVTEKSSFAAVDICQNAFFFSHFYSSILQ